MYISPLPFPIPCPLPPAPTYHQSMPPHGKVRYSVYSMYDVYGMYSKYVCMYVHELQCIPKIFKTFTSHKYYGVFTKTLVF